MTSFARTVALGLVLIAFLLLGYAWYSERGKNSDLEDTIASQQNTIRFLNDNRRERENGFYLYLLSQDRIVRIEQIAQEGSLEDRQRLASDLSTGLDDYWVQFVAAKEVVVRLEALVAEPDQAVRTGLAEALIDKISELTPVADASVSAAPVIEQGFAFISTLVAVLGSVGSALASAFLFLTSGGRRRIEEEMLAIDLEKQKIELAQMRYAARDALDATLPIPERSTS